MTIEIKLPALGENVRSGDVVDVLVNAGDRVAMNQDVIRVDTGAGVRGVPCPHQGIVKQVHVKPGDALSAGAVVLILDEATSDPPNEPHWPLAQRRGVWLGNDATTSPPAQPTVISDDDEPGNPPLALAEPGDAEIQPLPTLPILPVPTPLRFKLAEQTFAESETTATDPPPTDADNTEEPDDPDGKLHLAEVFDEDEDTDEAADDAIDKAVDQDAVDQDAAEHDAWGPIRRLPLSRRRETIAARMARSASAIPHVTNFDDADITELERIRGGSMADYVGDVKLTMLSFVLKAVAMALKRYPEVNASIDSENQEIVYKDYIHLGVAVDTDDGLVVPVLRDVERLSIPQIARALAQLAENARNDGRGEDDSHDNFQGGTFTVSNLGAVGGSYSTPMIHDPEVAILLIGRSRKVPVVVEDDIVVRRTMPLSLSYDQRLIDGATAARFLNEVIELLEVPGRLLLAP